jgi:hypothetical protein
LDDFGLPFSVLLILSKLVMTLQAHALLIIVLGQKIRERDPPFLRSWKSNAW